MQTVYTLIRRLILRHLIWVYTVCQCPFYGTLGLNGINKYGVSTHWKHLCKALLVSTPQCKHKFLHRNILMLNTTVYLDSGMVKNQTSLLIWSFFSLFFKLDCTTCNILPDMEIQCCKCFETGQAYTRCEISLNIHGL